MGNNASNSLADPICPTYAAGSFSKVSLNANTNLNNDSASASGANGYANTVAGSTVGSFNNDWTNGDLTQSVTPTYSSSLIQFGNTGLQS